MSTEEKVKVPILNFILTGAEQLLRSARTMNEFLCKQMRVLLQRITKADLHGNSGCRSFSKMVPYIVTIGMIVAHDHTHTD